MSLLLSIAGLWLSTMEGPEIKLPRSWILGREVSACTLRPSDVIHLLGRPDEFCSSMWHVCWYYRRLGVWFEWECPVYYCCFANVRFTPRESLVEVGWSAWSIKCLCPSK